MPYYRSMPSLNQIARLITPSHKAALTWSIEHRERFAIRRASFVSSVPTSLRRRMLRVTHHMLLIDQIPLAWLKIYPNGRSLWLFETR